MTTDKILKATDAEQIIEAIDRFGSAFGRYDCWHIGIDNEDGLLCRYTGGFNFKAETHEEAQRIYGHFIAKGMKPAAMYSEWPVPLPKFHSPDSW